MYGSTYLALIIKYDSLGHFDTGVPMAVTIRVTEAPEIVAPRAIKTMESDQPVLLYNSFAEKSKFLAANVASGASLPLWGNRSLSLHEAKYKPQKGTNIRSVVSGTATAAERRLRLRLRLRRKRKRRCWRLEEDPTRDNIIFFANTSHRFQNLSAETDEVQLVNVTGRATKRYVEVFHKVSFLPKTCDVRQYDVPISYTSPNRTNAFTSFLHHHFARAS
jgi:hypothetical protein